MANPFNHDRFQTDISYTNSYPQRSYPQMRDLPSPPPTSRFGAGFTRSPHSPLNRLSYLLNSPSEPTSDLYAANPSSQRPNDSMDTDMNNGYLDGAISSQTRLPQLPLYSRAFEQFMQNGEHNKEVAFTPSYLDGSDYIRKLDEARKAKQARKEAQQQAGNGLSAGITAGALASKPPASHLGMTYDLIERAPTVDDEIIVPPLPTKWNKDDKQGPLEVLADGLEVKYASGRTTREQEHEACAIRADHPMPWQAGLYYFEVSLLSRRRDETTVCIGFSAKNVPLARPPGWEPDSWGYHGDDGDIYSGDKIGKPYEGKNFGPPDIIGCGVNFRTREAFFTKNGRQFKTAFRDIKGNIYPTVGMKKPGEHIRVNFGQTKFMFQIDNLVKKEQEKMMAAINRTSMERLVSPPKNETDLIQQLVLQFLQHDGYVETARAFAEEIHAEKRDLQIDQQTPVPGINIKDDEDAHHRQRIRRAILEGDIEKAVKYTYTYYPSVLKENYDVYFKLRCRTFIEMVRKSAEISNSNAKKSNGHPYDDTPNKMDVDENGFSDQMEEDGLDTPTDQEDWLVKAVQYGQSLQEDFRDDTRSETTKTLNEVFSLLAYPNPLEVKEVAPLLDRKGRVAVAEELNSAILSSLGKSSRSALENLYGQTSVLLDYLREDGGPGSFITIQSVVDAIPQPF
ncbi:SPRY-domain-containing protein [Daldinia decipiens]|uniref:SPRY-domain-containing protein n=1 Tax=Daldinia decipiens TaxID=326647 RepID=UPI0020C3AA76|nr:SPRY-domain-containing protein [Daldinia decipiens]KAI1657251.1 SPRY-domain-containing protein [Daldinia decipiens]